MVCFCLWVLKQAIMSLYSSNVAIGYNGVGFALLSAVTTELT